MNSKFYINFAEEWENNWNSLNVENIVKHYHDDIVFRSNKAIQIMGKAEIKGIVELKEYWSRALINQPDLHFKVLDVFSGAGMMVITYVNHKEVKAAETLYFDGNTKVIMASACHSIK